MRSKFLFVILAGMLPLLSADAQTTSLVPLMSTNQARTVIAKDAGSFFQEPDGFSYSDYGIFEGSVPANALDPNTIQILYAKMNQFSPSDASAVRGFPFNQLKQYEAQQIAAGNSPIFVTATYEGKSRPVVFSWSLGLQNGIATAPAQDWQYAVNVSDPRYVHFWINNYARAVLGQAAYGTPNLWFQLDECAFDWDIFGVLDDNNRFITGVTWDEPFPQNAAAYLQSVASFFNQLKQDAPDVNVLPNVGTTTDPSQFPTIFTRVPGAMHENLYSWHATPTAYIRNLWYTQTFPLFSWLGAHNKVAILRALLPAGDSNALTSSFVVYSLLKGPDFFFAPGGASNGLNVPPSEWQGAEALLGSANGTFQSQQQAGMSAGYELFWRNFQGGIVYLNWTGSTQTIKLNAGVTYFNPAGQQITEIILPDLTGTYVTTASSIAAPPQITPLMSHETSGAQTLSLNTSTNGFTHYTLDNTTPTESSPIYTGPIELTGDAILQARTYKAGQNTSWISAANFVVSMKMPAVVFANSSDTGPAGTYYPLLFLTSVPTETVSVTYRVQQPNGSSSTGIATFLPGQNYRYFPVSISGTQGQTATVTITSASAAAVGPNRTFSISVDQ